MALLRAHPMGDGGINCKAREFPSENEAKRQADEVRKAATEVIKNEFKKSVIDGIICK